MAHRVPLSEPWCGLSRLALMAGVAVEECLAEVPREEWSAIPLMLCTAEQGRPGRLEGLNVDLLAELERQLATRFAPESVTIGNGRVSICTALEQAHELIANGRASRVLIAAADSLLSWPTLSVYERANRLLTPVNSNGFLPGEGAGAILVGPARKDALICLGLAHSDEPAHIDSEHPLRGEGLARAMRGALNDAGCEMHDMDFRITDLSGEQYYFKEATLALARLLRRRKAEFDIWHPAECIGETGALAGVAMLCVAEAARRKDYAAGPNVLLHMANDDGQRAALVCRCE